MWGVGGVGFDIKKKRTARVFPSLLHPSPCQGLGHYCNSSTRGRPGEEEERRKEERKKDKRQTDRQTPKLSEFDERRFFKPSLTV